MVMNVRAYPCRRTINRFWFSFTHTFLHVHCWCWMRCIFDLSMAFFDSLGSQRFTSPSVPLYAFAEFSLISFLEAYLSLSLLFLKYAICLEYYSNHTGYSWPFHQWDYHGCNGHFTVFNFLLASTPFEQALLVFDPASAPLSNLSLSHELRIRHMRGVSGVGVGRDVTRLSMPRHRSELC